MGSIMLSRSAQRVRTDGMCETVFNAFLASCLLGLRWVRLPQMDLSDSDRFVVIACDGLWDVFSSQQVVDLVHQFLEDGNSPEVRARCRCGGVFRVCGSDSVW